MKKKPNLLGISEPILLSLLNAIQDGITIKDRNHRILMQNEMAKKMNQHKEAIGQLCYEINYGGKKPCDHCHIQEARETGQLVKKKDLFYAEGREGRIFEIYAYPIRNDQGAITGTIEYLRDMTEPIKQAKQMTAIQEIGSLANASLEIEKVLATILQNTTELVGATAGMVFVKESETGFLHCGASQGLSKNLAETLKKQPIPIGEGLTGEIAQTRNSIFIPKDSSKDPRIVRPVDKNEEFHSFLGVPIVAGEELIGVLNVMTHPPAVLEEKVIEVVSIISGQAGLAIKNAHMYQEQQEKERKSHLLISQMQLGMALHEMICDEKGNPVDYRFLSINDSFQRITGLRQEEILGKTVLEVLPETEAYWIQEYGKVALTGVTAEFENYSAALDKYYHVNAYSPQHGQFAVIVEDVTEKRKVALALVQAKEAAEEANQAKSQFLANMSHELRTPLNGLMGMLQLLQTTNLTAEQREYIQLAMNGFTSLSSVVGDILNYTSLEKKHHSLVKAPIALEDLLAEVMRLHEITATQKGIALTLDIEKNLPTQVVGDGFKLKQILGNLVGNAVKFTENGYVQVRVKKGKGIPKEGDLKIKFHVEDTGIGIPPDKMDYIFHPFTQTDESHTRAHGGLGLGLATAQEQAAMIGGRITADSIPGQGSRFTFLWEGVSIVEESVLEMEQQEQGVYLKAPKKRELEILVVDDDYVSRLVAEKHLKKMGYQVAVAKDGQEAVDKCTDHTFGLVLMDCQMPVMTGYEATQRIREIQGKNKKPMPIVAMTARVLPGDREKCLEVGMDGFIAKPFDKKTLQETVKQFVRA